MPFAETLRLEIAEKARVEDKKKESDRAEKAEKRRDKIDQKEDPLKNDKNKLEKEYAVNMRILISAQN